MDWQQLLSARRLGSSRPGRSAGDRNRTEFQVDFDRIVFSSAFRRLQDKTQVFPLSSTGNVRTRLTHSLESASVGRSLGTQAGQRILERKPELASTFHPTELGAIVASACLAHDIGNPPFGHAGESAIAHWFDQSEDGREILSTLDDEAQREDFRHFEGNAQGFRVLTRLQHAAREGGMRLTCATLAAFVKYPCGADERNKDSVIHKKHGFFAADRSLFEEVATEVGLLKNSAGCCRHPLAYLVEAADDICYHVVDLEDGFHMGLLSEDEVRDCLAPIADNGRNEETSGPSPSPSGGTAQIERLRGTAIGSLVTQTVEAFIEQLEPIMEGSYTGQLTKNMRLRHEFARLKELAAEKVYPHREVALVEAAGFSVLGRLIEIHLSALNDCAKGNPSSQSTIVKKLFPPEFQQAETPYERVLRVTDYVSGLSDRNAVSLYKRLSGISLPGGEILV